MMVPLHIEGAPSSSRRRAASPHAPPPQPRPARAGPDAESCESPPGALTSAPRPVSSPLPPSPLLSAVSRRTPLPLTPSGRRRRHRGRSFRSAPPEPRPAYRPRPQPTALPPRLRNRSQSLRALPFAANKNSVGAGQRIRRPGEGRLLGRWWAAAGRTGGCRYGGRGLVEASGRARSPFPSPYPYPYPSGLSCPRRSQLWACCVFLRTYCLPKSHLAWQAEKWSPQCR
ncbi:atherin-like [Coturnix japonica]|uniref:atherin-like n=1 Tax=Coturnix japonica TaxID=93934 RepID=UPI0013A5E1C6|nr:atherin-like [Coturnix japonica]